MNEDCRQRRTVSAVQVENVNTTNIGISSIRDKSASLPEVSGRATDLAPMGSSSSYLAIPRVPTTLITSARYCTMIYIVWSLHCRPNFVYV